MSSLGHSQELTNKSSIRQTPLRVQFVLTSLPVGGAEVLLLNLMRKLDRAVIEPQVVCLKEPGELAEQIAAEVPLTSRFLSHKSDLRVLPRLAKHFKANQTDAVITVGAGDKMFWGRLAAFAARVPVICSALHSTGWPDGVGKLNRCLNWMTDGFIAVAENHAEHMSKFERFPRDSIFTIPNGVDTNRFRPAPDQRSKLRKELKIDQDASLIGIVAALRPEKNHQQFLEAAHMLLQRMPNTHFVIVGDGPKRSEIESQIVDFEIQDHVHLLGTRQDTPSILAGLDAFCLTSKNEANPVSILEALACEIPVVSPNVGSIKETVIPDQTGFLTEPLSAESTATALYKLLQDRNSCRIFGQNGRQLVRDQWSLNSMAAGYENLVVKLYNQKAKQRRLSPFVSVNETQPKNETVIPTALSITYPSFPTNQNV